jgi:hypothetical protein
MAGAGLPPESPGVSESAGGTFSVNAIHPRSNMETKILMSTPSGVATVPALSALFMIRSLPRRTLDDLGSGSGLCGWRPSPKEFTNAKVTRATGTIRLVASSKNGQVHRLSPRASRAQTFKTTTVHARRNPAELSHLDPSTSSPSIPSNQADNGSDLATVFPGDLGDTGDGNLHSGTAPLNHSRRGSSVKITFSAIRPPLARCVPGNRLDSPRLLELQEALLVQSVYVEFTQQRRHEQRGPGRSEERGRRSNSTRVGLTDEQGRGGTSACSDLAKHTLLYGRAKGHAHTRPWCPHRSGSGQSQTWQQSGYGCAGSVTGGLFRCLPKK